MIRTIRRFRRTILVLGFTLALGSKAAASEDAPISKVVEFNKKAIAAYEALDMDNAALNLKQALELCAAEGIDNHPAAARTHIHLGVVYITGLGEKEKGIAEFRRAIGIDPGIKVTKSLLTAEVKAAFDEAGELGPLRPVPPAFPTALPAHRKAPERPAAAPQTAAIIHPPITEAGQNTSIEIKALIPATMRAERILLAYRPGEDGEFLAREMRPIENAPGWYHEKIPVEATRGNGVRYYIEAQNEEGQPLSTSGDPASPHVIRLTPEPRHDEGRPQTTNVREAADEFPIWVVFAMGGGAGYFSGLPETGTRSGASPAKTNGFALARLAHLAPEVGYFHTPHLLFSVQGRLQYVTSGHDQVRNGRTYASAHTALALLAKASYHLASPSATVQPFVGAQVGFGDIRYPVTTPALSDCGEQGIPAPCKDTTRGGVALAGVFLGLTYMVAENVGLYAALSGLAGVPNVAVNGDLNVGIAFIR